MINVRSQKSLNVFGGSELNQQTSLEIVTFGMEFGAFRKNVPIPLRPKDFLLLVYLVVERRSIAREELWGMFWPESEPDRAKHSLNQALHTIRRSIPELECRVERGRVRSSLSALVDAAVFESAFRSSDTETVINTYTGAFLDGCEADGELGRWRDDARDRFQSQYSATLWRELNERSASSDWSQVERLASLLTKCPGWEERAEEQRLTAIALLGDPDRIKLELSLAERNARELMSDTSYSRLTDRIRRLVSSERGVRASSFVGRNAETKSLLKAWNDSLHGASRVIVMTGESGIGKTALVQQFLRQVALKGGHPIMVRCDASRQHVPYGLIRDVILGCSQNTIDKLRPASRHVLSLLSGERSPEIEIAPTRTDPLRDGAADALLDALGHEVEGGCVLFIDDAHVADSSSLHLLSELNTSTSFDSLFLLLACRTGGSRSGDAGELFHRLGPTTTFCQLDELDSQSSTELVDSFERRNGFEFSEQERSTALTIARGQPFFLLTVLTAIRNGDFELSPGSIARTTNVGLIEHLRTRIRSLSPISTATLGALACFGTNVSIEDLGEVSRIGEQDLFKGIEELCASKLATDDLQGIRCLHDLVAEATSSETTTTRSRLYHRRIAELYRLKDASPSLLAFHFEKAGMSREACEAALTAAELSERLSAFTETEQLLQNAIRVAPDLMIQNRVKLAMARAYLRVRRYDDADRLYRELDASHDPRIALESRVAAAAVAPEQSNRTSERCIELLQGIAAEAAALGETNALLEVLLLLASHCAANGDSALMQGVLRELTNGDYQDALPILQVARLSIAGQLTGLLGDVEEGAIIIDRACEIAEDLPSWQAQVRSQSARGWLNLIRGRAPEALASMGKALGLLDENGAQHWYSDLSNNHSLALWHNGRTDDALRAFRSGAELAGRLRHGMDRYFCLMNLGFLLFENGDHAAASTIGDTLIGENQIGRREVVEVAAHCLRGLCALAEERPADANEAASRVLAAEEKIGVFSDSTYPEMFLARWRFSIGDTALGLERLNAAITRERKRHPVCWAELTLERARLVLATDFETACTDLETARTFMEENRLELLRPKVERLQRAIHLARRAQK